jgi:hypothetical protein
MHPSHRVLALHVLHILFASIPACHEWLIRSPLIEHLISALPEETCQVKKATLLLLCAMSRSIELYTQYFLEHGVFHAYMDGIDLESKQVRAAVVNSLALLLKHAIMRGDAESREALLEIFREAELVSVLEDVAADSEDEELLKTIDFLNRLIK